MAARPQGMRELKVRRPRPVTPRTPRRHQNPKNTQVEDALLYLDQVKAEFGDARRTEIVASQVDLTIADLITEEERVVTISHGGYAKSQPLASYQAQRRGGRGKSATGVKDEDYIEHLLVANSHATLLLFSSKGKV